ncbi:protein hunchback [Bactrocera dorsalis]|uniref:Protein hunchback n=1 Tax=Bactrocera dorsalis TaxID=27457 RepID=A0A6I9V5U8_BACDO|nr:protein hunchback [Bactrocera dorsalis]XP_029408362.2 protein hunchback [Bactrocera dorsalis]
MQNWDTMQATSASYEQHNSWYNSMFTNTNIKTEPGTTSPSLEQELKSPESNVDVISHLENYLKHHQQTSHQISAMDTLSAMTPSPSNADSMQHLYDGSLQQQLLQQKHYQQHFQQAQQAAAHNQVTSSNLPLGFNPLTPPGLPSAVIPSISQYYHHLPQSNMRTEPQTPSPLSHQSHMTTPMDSSEKLQTALTPRNTPPMDITPPKSPKPQSAICSETINSLEKDQDVQSNSSDDMKYGGESGDDESIRFPLYNSHGKMKNYKCKTCGAIWVTKIQFWDHVRTHMKPDKILQCPKCPFVTELKHHLEYHIRKHKNLKPFQCDKCSYTCVNKSMLNSHRKSHSSVYQYRCADCDYATKYCHSFKLHLRKYEHKPGLVLDEEGVPNPSVVIDVYGTRRGPKSKSTSSSIKRSNNTNSNNVNERLTAKSLQDQKNSTEYKLSEAQLSTALQSFSLPTQHHQMPVSPAKSPSSISELSSHSQGLSQQNTRQQQKRNLPTENTETSSTISAITDTNSPMTSLLPPLATLLQQNPNMAFFPYWNLNLQMLAAQQQAVVLAQMSPSRREKALRKLQNAQSAEADDEEVDDVEDEVDRKSTDSAMDLSQGSPVKDDPDNRKTPVIASNIRLQDESNNTPIVSTNGAAKRKGRVLKLDAFLQVKSTSQSPDEKEEDTFSQINTDALVSAAPPPLPTSFGTSTAQVEGTSKENEELVHDTLLTAKEITSSTASSSGNSSNSSSTSSTVTTNERAATGTIYECKYCDIYFKDTVIYTIHMGYHSCDDVFKCNMCGEKCDGPVGLFVHMARNAHS